MELAVTELGLLGNFDAVVVAPTGIHKGATVGAIDITVSGIAVEVGIFLGL